MKVKTYLLISLIFILLSACGEKEVKREEVLRPIRYEVVGTADAQKIRTFSGIAKAGDEIELSFRSSGIITELNVKIGQKVKKGDLIAKLDNVQANLAYEQSVSALNTAKSAMNTSKSNLDRVKSLYEKGSSSLSDYEAAKNTHQANSDQYESAKRNKSIQESQISYGYIYAPKNGVIASRNADLNENASAGQVIAILNAGNETIIEVGLPENIINEVQLGMATSLDFSAIKNQSFEGSVIEIAPIVDANSASYPVKISIDNKTGVVKAGMTVSVTFNFESESATEDKSLYIPVKAVGEDGNGNYVFIVESTDGIVGEVKKQTISIGELSSNGFKVLDGLFNGQKVATAGLQTLLDGQKVKLQ